MNKIAIKHLNLLLCSIIFSIYSPLIAKDIPIYPTINYTINDYKAGTQNWSIAEAEDGTLYFANNNGLLVKNGTDWAVCHTSGNQIIRALAINKDKVYSGGGSEFGYFTKNLSGSYKYTSLSNKELFADNEVWRIKICSNRVYFQSSNAMYVFNTDTDELLNKMPLFRIDFVSLENNQLLFQSSTDGIFTTDLNLNNKRKLAGKSELKEIVIREVLYINGMQYFFSLENGIFLLKNGVLTPLNNDINKILTFSQIYNVSKTKDKIIIGTILDGIYILDYSFNTIEHINKRTGLNNNTVLSLYIDKENNVWAGLDNGISYIEINSNLRYYNFSTDIGTGYASYKMQNFNYWGTNQGLYYTKDNTDTGIKLISNTQGQIWCFEEINGKLYCGHHKGLFEINQANAKLIDGRSGVMNIIRLNEKSDYYFMIEYFYLALHKYNYKTHSLDKISDIPNTLKLNRDIKNDRDGNMWFLEGDSIIKFNIDTTKCSINEQKRYYKPGEKYLFTYDNDILLWYDKVFYKYKPINDSFEKCDYVSFTRWNCTDLLEMIHHLPLENLAKITINSKMYIYDFSRLKNNVQWNVQFATRHQDYLVLNENSGFAFYEFKSVDNNYNPKIKVVINEVKIKSKAHKEYQWIENPVIDYSDNNIRFKFNSNRCNIVYQYKLKGYDEDYSLFSSKNIKEYTNLNEGDYVFEVMAKDVVGNISEIERFEFSIKPPFYRSNTAKFIYFLFLLIAIFCIIKLMKYLLHRKEQQLNAIRQREVDELEQKHKIETLKKEKTLILKEKENLEESFAHKLRELTNSTYNVISKNNLLAEIKESLSAIHKEKNIESKNAGLRKTLLTIDANINNEEDWVIFEKYFSEIHENFFSDLKKDFPDISSTELKLCAYIRLNKSTKEIASLMNITVRGVETSRYRLRKKLNLGRDENIFDKLSKY